MTGRLESARPGRRPKANSPGDRWRHVATDHSTARDTSLPDQQAAMEAPSRSQQPSAADPASRYRRPAQPSPARSDSARPGVASAVFTESSADGRRGRLHGNERWQREEKTRARREKMVVSGGSTWLRSCGGSNVADSPSEMRRKYIYFVLFYSSDRLRGGPT